MAEPVTATETHISILFFGPDRVYKFLKPVTTGFLDHSTVERRLAAVTAEYHLNRRFAPDVYLGTSDLYERGELTDRVLIMRRLPADRRLSLLVESPDFGDHVRRVAHKIAAFHAAAPVTTDPYPMTTASGLLELWESSFTEIEPSVGSVIDADEFNRVRHLARRYLDHAEPLFGQRRRAGQMRDGHGDLTAEDIFVLDDGLRILDCLAFDDDYRISDVLADIAFLVMDIERLAGATLARELLAHYCEFVDEHHPSSLAHHYVAYRAHVRAKVALLRLRQGDEPSRDLAVHYHQQAAGNLERARRRLVMVGGGPGTGKTTVSRRLADLFNFAVIDSDTLRKDLRGVDHDDHRVDRHPELYGSEATADTYARLIAHAGVLLESGESVIVDATWSDADHRAVARAVADRHGADVVELECRLDPDVARDRIAKRRSTSRDASDATPDLVSQMAIRRQPWPNAKPLDTSRRLDDVVDEAARAISSGDAPATFRT